MEEKKVYVIVRNEYEKDIAIEERNEENVYMEMFFGIFSTKEKALGIIEKLKKIDEEESEECYEYVVKEVDMDRPLYFDEMIEEYCYCDQHYNYKNRL